MIRCSRMLLLYRDVARMSILYSGHHTISKLLRCMWLCIDTIVETRETCARFVDRWLLRMPSEGPLPDEAFVR